MKKEIKFYNDSIDTLHWGSWSEFKKDFLKTAYQNTKNYHGDVFISFDQLEKFIAENSEKDFQVYISFHESGSDFFAENDEMFDYYINRIHAHKGKTILLTNSNLTVNWIILDNIDI